MRESYHFKVTDKKSSWGIVVNLTAEDFYEEAIEGDLKITDRILLRCKLPFRLLENELEYIVRAIRDMSFEVSKGFSPDQPVMLINILEIEFADTDYQPEGLYCAMAGWIAKRFKVPMPLIGITFDSIKNRYVFDFNGQQHRANEE